MGFLHLGGKFFRKAVFHTAEVCLTSSECGAVWERTRFGPGRSMVRIHPLRPICGLRCGRSVRYPVVTRIHAGSSPATSAKPKKGKRAWCQRKHCGVPSRGGRFESDCSLQIQSDERMRGSYPVRARFDSSRGTKFERGLLAQLEEYAATNRGIQVRVLGRLPPFCHSHVPQMAEGSG